MMDCETTRSATFEFDSSSSRFDIFILNPEPNTSIMSQIIQYTLVNVPSLISFNSAPTLMCVSDAILQILF